MVEKIALLADIHGNSIALEAVLSLLKRDGINQAICLGDVAIFGPQPRETLACVRDLACPVVMGNTDAWALDPKPHPIRNQETELFNAVELWSAAQLTDDDLAFIRTFEPVVETTLANGTTLCCYHGSPYSFNDGIVATTPDDEIAALLAGYRATIMAGGHTHAQMVRRFSDMLLINPGSVGRAYEIAPDDGKARELPWAEYAILTADGTDLAVELRRTPYDHSALADLAFASGMPHVDWWMGE